VWICVNYWGCSIKMKNSDCKATGSISQQVISDHEKSVSASVFASSHLCEFVSPLCSVVVFLYSSFLSFSCVLSRFCLVFGFCRFLNNPFTLFLRYSVDYIWSTMEQWRQYLCRFLYTCDFLWSPPLFLNNADSYNLSYL